MAATDPAQKWSRTIIEKMTIPKLEEALLELGLSIVCESTKRSKELKKRLKSHLYPEIINDSQAPDSKKDFLK